MATSNESSQVQMLLDQFAIRDVIARYCRGIDRRDWELVRSTFHPDAVDDHGVYKGGVDGFIDFVSQRHHLVTMSMHHIGNILVEFESPERALVETYCMATQRYAPGGGGDLATENAEGQSATSSGRMEIRMWVRYVDILAKRDGQWRIAIRRVAWDGMRADAIPVNGLQPGADWIIGQRDDSDLVYEQQRSLGLRGPSA